MRKIVLFFLAFCLLQADEKAIPLSFSFDGPIWQEGDALPPEGYSIVAICARDRGLRENNPTSETTFRTFASIFGHAWIERVDSQGQHTCISTEKNKSTMWLKYDDIQKYQFDRDTIRISFLVKDSTANLIFQNAENYAKEGYNLFFHNCVHTTFEGASALDVNQLFEKAFLNLTDDNAALVQTGRITQPHDLYKNIEDFVFVLKEWPKYNIFNPDPAIRKEMQWISLACSDNEVAFFSPSKTFLEIERQYFAAEIMPWMHPPRGNFGGISFSLAAELCLNIQEIHGAIFDSETMQLILIGKKPIYFPKMRLDDFAVAVQSVYGLNGKAPENPGVSIEPSQDRAVVRYMGQTAGTEFGKVLFEADLALKYLLIGSLSCKVSGFESILEKMAKNPSQSTETQANRTWIMPEKISLIESMDGSAMIFTETKMRAYTEPIGHSVDPNYLAFTDHFTRNYDSIAEEYPIFSEIKRLGQITSIVKWMKDNQISLELSFFQSYVPTPVNTPTETALITNQNNRWWISGGVTYPLLKEQNFFTRKDFQLDSFKETVLKNRAHKSDLIWEVDETLSAVAYPLFKTRKTGGYQTYFIDHYFLDGMAFVRYYDSFTDDDVGLGRGWMITPFQVLMLNETNGSIVIREKSNHWIYKKIAPNLYSREDGLNLLQIYGNKMALFFTDGGSAYFDSMGILYKEIKSDLLEIDYTYQEGKLFQIHSPRHSFTLLYDHDRLVGLMENEEMLCTYQFEKSNLAQARHEQLGEGINYEYDIDNNLTKITKGGKVHYMGRFDPFHRLRSFKGSF